MLDGTVLKTKGLTLLHGNTKVTSLRGLDLQFELVGCSVAQEP